MKIKFLITVLLCLSLITLVVAENVDPYETVQLPQLTSNISLDTEGLQRTYLYCSWRIDGNGEEAISMDSEICPDPQEQFTFEDSQTYMVRIDYAKIGYSGAGNWAILEVGNAGEQIIEYNLDVAEPPSSIFSAIYNNIIAGIRSWLCDVFPGLPFC